MKGLIARGGKKQRTRDQSLRFGTTTQRRYDGICGKAGGEMMQQALVASNCDPAPPRPLPPPPHTSSPSLLPPPLLFPLFLLLPLSPLPSLTSIPSSFPYFFPLFLLLPLSLLPSHPSIPSTHGLSLALPCVPTIFCIGSDVGV